MKEIHGIKLIKPRPTPRLPPVTDVNNADLMLGVVVLAIIGACMLAGIIWTVSH